MRVYRSLRTEFMNCETDIEYIGKLICVRHGFSYILAHGDQVAWVAQVGRSIVCGTLACLGYATSDFEDAYSYVSFYLKLDLSVCRS